MHTVAVTVINARVHRSDERQHRAFVHNSFVCFTVCDLVRAPQLALCVWEKRVHAANGMFAAYEVGKRFEKHTSVTVSGSARAWQRQHLVAVQTRERQSGNACMHAQPVTSQESGVTEGSVAEGSATYP